jgi:hypothetical protein
MTEYIYYKGLGANKTGKHTVKEFLEIMNKKFGISCSSTLLTQSDYKPCSEYIKMNRDFAECNFRNLDTKTKKPCNKSKKYKKVADQCEKYRQSQKRRKCTLDEYIKYSDAKMVK